MSEPVQFDIPAIQTYSEIEPAFQACTSGDYIIPVAWGAISRVVGKCQEYRLGSGQCIGAFHSRDVDTSDTPWACINQENRASDVCRVNNVRSGSYPAVPPSEAASTFQESSSSSSAIDQKSGHQNPVVRSLKDFPVQLPPQNMLSLSANQGYYNPYINGSNPYMSFDVFDKPFLSRGKQSTSDPAGYLMGVSNYVGLQQRAEASTMLPNEPWSSCSSYGNYNSIPSGTLSADSCIGNNCKCGTYTEPACSS